MFKHMIIPTDGSPLAQRAAKAGIRLASTLGARVLGYYALEALQPIYVQGYVFDTHDVVELERRASNEGQKHLEKIGTAAKAAGVPFRPVVTKTNVAYDGILRAAKKYKCDVIFMASHGRRGLSKFILGSVTQRVLAQSNITVIVYR